MNSSKILLWDDCIDVIRLKGSGVRKFLQGQTTTEILKAQKNTPIRTCRLSVKGKVLFLLEIIITDYFTDIFVLFGDINRIIDEFNKVIFPVDKVEIEVVNNIRRIQKINFQEKWIKSDFILINDKKILPDYIKDYHRATLDQIEEWRIIQGIPSLDKELNGNTNPFELGLAELVNLDKGCYLGQEIIARLVRSGVRNQLKLWESKHSIKPGKNFLKVVEENKDKVKNIAGTVTSCFSIDDNHHIGLAVIRNKYLQEDELCIEGQLGNVFLKDPIGISEIKSINDR
tara:strand:+ start:366 stop:1223 length:858 start_codon:yes stop_codon:yes gene_type:complete